jgi:hypothetical protein
MSLQLNRLNEGKTMGAGEEFDEVMGDKWDDKVMKPFERFLHDCFRE